MMSKAAGQSELGVYPVPMSGKPVYNIAVTLVTEEVPMKSAKLGGIKRRVILTYINEEDHEEVMVYRVGRLGLAVSLPARPQYKYTTQPSSGIFAVSSGRDLTRARNHKEDSNEYRSI